MSILEVQNIRAGYDVDVDVLTGLSLQVLEGECIALIGANGAGKSTLLKVISGILKPKNGEIYYKSNRIDKLSPHSIVDLGIVQVPEEGGTFNSLTVEENLQISCRRKIAKVNKKENLQVVYEFFPILKDKQKVYAKSLSGGQRKMLAIGKAIMQQPEFLLLDDISMGLAPKITWDLYERLNLLTKKISVPVIIVEQIVEIALDFAKRGYVIVQGKVAMEGPSEKLLRSEDVKKFYIGA